MGCCRYRGCFASILFIQFSRGAKRFPVASQCGQYCQSTTLSDRAKCIGNVYPVSGFWANSLKSNGVKSSVLDFPTTSIQTLYGIGFERQFSTQLRVYETTRARCYDTKRQCRWRWFKCQFGKSKVYARLCVKCVSKCLG